MREEIHPPAPRPSPPQIRSALAAVVKSDVFKNATRLQEFLTYVVEESLAGRRDKIPAKLISEAVYNRPVDATADNENVVRVDAGRLRRRLEQYYLDEGKDDPVRIHIDSGGYVPRFENRSNSESTSAVLPGRRWAMPAATVLGAIVVAGVAYMVGSRHLMETDARQPLEGSAPDSLRALERQAIYDSSPTSLQAVNLAEQARGLIFPIFDVERLRITTDMFRQVIRLDSRYFGGYAGAAQTLGSLAWLSPPGPIREDLQSEADEMARLAMDLAPTSSWTQSAGAWVAFTGQDLDRALRLSNRSVRLSPDDGNILDFHALICLFSGDFKSARAAADPTRSRIASNQRFANRNIFAAASFHLGNYRETIESFSVSARVGDPVSAPVLAFLAATYHAIGDIEMAQQKARELSENWPNFRPDILLRRIYIEREHADAVVNRLLAAGWTPTPPS